MSKRWADECSSDEDEEVEEEAPTAQHAEVSAASNSAVSGPTAGTDDSFFVFIGSIVPTGDSTRGDIGNFFADKGCAIKTLDVRPASDVRDHFYEARMVFSNPESVDIALNANGELYNTHPLRVTRVYENRSMASGGGRGGRGGGGGRREFRDRQDHRGGERDRYRDSDNYGGRRGGGRGGRGGRGGDRFLDSAEPREPVAPAEPPQRKKIVLAPRTLPLEAIGKAEPYKQEIFGGGKAHDDLVYEQEVKKKQSLAEPSKLDPPLEGPDTVFKLGAMKETLPEDRPASGIPPDVAPARGKGGRTAGRGGGDGGRWGRDTDSHALGRGRGGRAGERAGRTVSTESAAEATKGGDAQGSGSYIIQKPTEDGEAGARHGADGPQRGAGRGRGGRGGGPGRDEGHRFRDDNATGRGARPFSRSGPPAHAGDAPSFAGGEGPAAGATAEKDRERGPRSRPGADGGKLFAATAKRTNLLHSKPKVATGAGGEAAAGGAVASDGAGSGAATAAAAAPALTEEERFNKAQEKFAAKDKSGVNTNPAGKSRKVSTFAALGSDSDDE